MLLLKFSAGQLNTLVNFESALLRLHGQFSVGVNNLQRLYARAGITGATSHSGRRTWLTTLSQKGVSVFVLADMAGHASIQTTQRYVTVNDEMKRNAAELI